jgi:hypothetical protein
MDADRLPRSVPSIRFVTKNSTMNELKKSGEFSRAGNDLNEALQLDRERHKSNSRRSSLFLSRPAGYACDVHI